MMRRVVRYLAVVATIVAVAACSGERTLRLEDRGTQVRLHPGDEITLVLPGNPSTGYGWTVTDISPPILEQSGEPGFRPESDLIGAAGEFRFTFVAREEGSTLLALVYERPFEQVEPLDSFDVEVIVD